MRAWFSRISSTSPGSSSEQTAPGAPLERDPRGPPEREQVEDGERAHGRVDHQDERRENPR